MFLIFWLEKPHLLLSSLPVRNTHEPDIFTVDAIRNYLTIIHVGAYSRLLLSIYHCFLSFINDIFSPLISDTSSVNIQAIYEQHKKKKEIFALQQ